MKIEKVEAFVLPDGRLTESFGHAKNAWEKQRLVELVKEHYLPILGAEDMADILWENRKEFIEALSTGESNELPHCKSGV